MVFACGEQIIISREATPELFILHYYKMPLSARRSSVAAAIWLR